MKVEIYVQFEVHLNLGRFLTVSSPEEALFSLKLMQKRAKDCCFSRDNGNL